MKAAWDIFESIKSGLGMGSTKNDAPKPAEQQQPPTATRAEVPKEVAEQNRAAGPAILRHPAPSNPSSQMPTSTPKIDLNKVPAGQPRLGIITSDNKELYGNEAKSHLEGKGVKVTVSPDGRVSTSGPWVVKSLQTGGGASPKAKL